MLSGMEYNAADPGLLEELNRCRGIIFKYNQTNPMDMEARTGILAGFLGRMGRNCNIVPPFYCDYGAQVEVGDNFFANYNLTILDEGRVLIGDNVFLGPNVSIYTAVHPVDPVKRNSLIQSTKRVVIGSNVWIGGGVMILPGVTIGDNVTIGAGSIVVNDIPSDSVAVGNPCKVIRQI